MSITMKISLLSLLLICVFQLNTVQSVDPLVLTTQGLVRGTRSEDGTYSSFLGIPFATVNQDNPFGEALPGPIFQNVFEANDDSAICPHREEFNNTLAGTLDCLHINIYVPTSASINNPLPVMVWLYGGGFFRGFAGQYLYGPQYIVRHDVILVTMNYRLGPYGFMCLDTPSIPGNAGLKDQRAGMRWVKKNIAAFGGNSESITAFGESAGGMSINFHMLSPGSDNLFQRAIMQSGTAIVEEMVIHSRPSSPLEIAKYLGFNAESLEEALEIIKIVPTDDLVMAGLDLGITFRPCVEKAFDGVESIITDYPDIILQSGQYNSVPLLLGFNSHERLVRYLININNDDYYEQIQNFIFERLNAAFAFESETQANQAAEIVKNFYIGSKAVNIDAAYELNEFDSDLHFSHPTERLVEYTLEKSDVPMYEYLFGYAGELNYEKRRNNINESVAVHADEIGYLFKQIYVSDEINPEDQLMIDRMTTMWTNFAKYGDPTPEVNDILPVRWPTVSRELREYLYIDRELQVKQKPFHDRIAFWDLFFLTYGKYYRMVW